MPAIAEAIILATTLLEKLIPLLQEALQREEVSVEKQTQLKHRLAALRRKLEDDDLGDHWTVPDRD